MLDLLRLDGKTIVMGILNITPDSFSDGGKYFSDEKSDVNSALAHTQKMLAEGADIIDIGGESTRPGAQAVSAEEELARVLPVIQAIKAQFGKEAHLSIDTYKSAVADAALRAGVEIINSLGGARFDSNIYRIAKKYHAPIIIYHIKGEPRTMQHGEIVYSDVMKEIGEFFTEQILLAEQMGMKKQDVWLDPGIGFGKTVEQNLEIIARLREFETFGVPILIGVSRKSHLGIILKEALGLKEVPPATERLEASLAETVVAVLNGARIVRTHDVLATKKCLAVVDALRAREEL